MKNLSGFTFIKHGLDLGYPIRESIESISPLCDEVIINVGFDDPDLKKDDGTWEYLNDTLRDKKYVFLKSWWDPSLRKDGLILSQQTNIALSKCQGKYCQYIQGDETVHEDDFSTIEKGINLMEERPEVDGLIYKYIHFYGDVDVHLYTRRVYKREVRLIRGGKGHKSWKDAQGFRTFDDQKLKCLEIPATIYHYGWARKENIMDKKNKAFHKLYHENPEEIIFSYVRTWGLQNFLKTHPIVMKEWIKEHRNNIDVLATPYSFKFKDFDLIISDFFERLTGYRIGEYKNFKEIK
jgi:hypothetical protein